ncbi:hypothetical protein HK405_003120 [Cladochytrium tenue]|nr:hypothetical protein HK405_003120 [Cladochytrium tenue]
MAAFRCCIGIRCLFDLRHVDEDIVADLSSLIPVMHPELAHGGREAVRLGALLKTIRCFNGDANATLLSALELVPLDFRFDVWRRLIEKRGDLDRIRRMAATFVLNKNTEILLKHLETFVAQIPVEILFAADDEDDEDDEDIKRTFFDGPTASQRAFEAVMTLIPGLCADSDIKLAWKILRTLVFTLNVEWSENSEFISPTVCSHPEWLDFWNNLVTSYIQTGAHVNAIQFITRNIRYNTDDTPGPAFDTLLRAVQHDPSEIEDFKKYDLLLISDPRFGAETKNKFMACITTLDFRQFGGLTCPADFDQLINIHMEMTLAGFYAEQPRQLYYLPTLCSKFRLGLERSQESLAMLQFLSWNKAEFLQQTRLDAVVPILIGKLGVEEGVGAILGRVAGDLTTSQLVELLDVSLSALHRKTNFAMTNYDLRYAFSALLAALTQRGLTARVDAAAQIAFSLFSEKIGWHLAWPMVEYVGRVELQVLSGIIEDVLDEGWCSGKLSDALSALTDRAAAEIKNGTFTYPDFEHALIGALVARAGRTDLQQCEGLKALPIIHRLHHVLGGASRASHALTRALMTGLLKSMHFESAATIRLFVSELLSSQSGLPVDGRSEDFLHAVWARLGNRVSRRPMRVTEEAGDGICEDLVEQAGRRVGPSVAACRPRRTVRIRLLRLVPKYHVGIG